MPFENWEDDNKRSPAAIALIVILSLVVIAGSAYAVYKLTSPPSPPIVVTEPSALAAPSLNATTAVVGDTVQITTQLSDSAEGVHVFFYQEGTATSIGSAYTNSEGQAIFNHPLTTTGTFTYIADCVHP